jgi:hypothetical protein
VRRPGEKRTQGLAHASVVIDDDNFRRYGRHTREGKGRGWAAVLRRRLYVAGLVCLFNTGLAV